MTAACALHGVTVRAGAHALLDGVDLEVRDGEILAVLGPTGAGKTTLLRVLAFLRQPDAGRLAWRGEPVRYPVPLPLRRRVAMAFQEALLFSGTVAQNVAYPLRLRGVPAAEREARVAAVLELLRIGPLAGRRAGQLSGGEAQRAALARAVVIRPDLLLLDEPLASLDAPVREALREELCGLIRAQGMTCVFVTHDQEEAFAVADRVAILEGGRVLQAGPRDDVLFRPATARVARFVRTTNVLPVRVVDRAASQTVVELAGARVRAAQHAPAGERLLACVRPEEIAIGSPGEAPGLAGQNLLPGAVVAVQHVGPSVKILVDCGVAVTALLPRRAADRLGLRPGDRVVVAFPPENVHLMPESADAAPGAAAG